MQTDTHISRLRIATTRRRGVPMVQSVVEDAFRTQESSVGRYALAGLLVLRCIDLGPIGDRHDQSRINRKVAAALRDAAARATRYDTPGAELTEAVLFPHALTPHLAVLRAVGRNEPWPTSWPWRAVLGEALFARDIDLAKAILMDLIEMQFAAPAIVMAFAELGNRQSAVLQEMPLSMVAALQRCLSSGAHCVDFSGQAAARAYHPEIIRAILRASGVRRALMELSNYMNDEPRAHLLLSAHLARVLNRAVAKEEAALLHTTLLSFLTARAGKPSQDPTNQDIDEFFGDISPSAHEGATGTQTDPRPQLPKVDRPSQDIARRRIRRAKNPAEDPKQSPRQAPLEVTPPATAPHDGPMREQPVPAASPKVGWPDNLPATRFAGLVLLITLIDRAFGTWLDTPQHIEAQTGQRLFRQIFARLPLHAEDPWRVFVDRLGVTPAEDISAPLPFSLLPEIAACLPGPVVFSQVFGCPGRRVATMAGGRISIAAWSGRMPPDLRELLRLKNGPDLRRGAPRAFSGDLLLVSCELALRRWLRRTARIPLAALVARVGHMQATGTHLDVIFDAGLVDLMVRRFGLDLSPGWCAWLWRVVTIHYDFGGEDA